MVFQEVDDSYDTVEWAAVQPWSTGAVGIYSSSYMGITCYQDVAGHPPHLRASIPFVASAGSLFDRPFGGMFEAEVLRLVLSGHGADDRVSNGYRSND
jgi:putative CocE/NonD family hydrolase